MVSSGPRCLAQVNFRSIPERCHDSGGSAVAQQPNHRGMHALSCTVHLRSTSSRSARAMGTDQLQRRFARLPDPLDESEPNEGWSSVYDLGRDGPGVDRKNPARVPFWGPVNHRLAPLRKNAERYETKLGYPFFHCFADRNGLGLRAPTGAPGFLRDSRANCGRAERDRRPWRGSGSPRFLPLIPSGTAENRPCRVLAMPPVGQTQSQRCCNLHGAPGPECCAAWQIAVGRPSVAGNRSSGAIQQRRMRNEELREQPVPAGSLY